MQLEQGGPWAHAHRGRASCLVPLLSLFGSIWGVAPLFGLGAKKSVRFAIMVGLLPFLACVFSYRNQQNHAICKTTLLVFQIGLHQLTVQLSLGFRV